MFLCKDALYGENGILSSISPRDRVVLHMEGKRCFLLRPSDGTTAFLGMPNPVLMVRPGTNRYAREAWIYQRASLPKHSKFYSTDGILSSENAFTASGTAEKLAKRQGNHVGCLFCIVCMFQGRANCTVTKLSKFVLFLLFSPKNMVDTER